VHPNVPVGFREGELLPVQLQTQPLDVLARTAKQHALLLLEPAHVVLGREVELRKTRLVLLLPLLVTLVDGEVALRLAALLLRQHVPILNHNLNQSQTSQGLLVLDNWLYSQRDCSFFLTRTTPRCSFLVLPRLRISFSLGFAVQS